MLATSSSILQLWNNQDYSFLADFGHEHLPTTDSIKCLDWKKDNSNYLVFTYKQTGRVQLFDLQKKKSVELSTTKAQCCSFSSSGKYLTVTNEDCEAQIWDVNSGRIAQRFCSVDESPMECVCWGNGDSYVAAGTRKGNVFIYNQLTKQTFAPFTNKQSNEFCCISSMKWSQHKDIIGTTSIDGSLSFWNCRLKELIHSIHCHKAPATDFSFSPHHESFVVSSGMDGSLCCFDLTQQKILSTISVYAPLTSVDFHPNGSLVAVGTMGQNAAIYDLRDPKEKLAHLVNCKHANVYSVRFSVPSSSNCVATTSTKQSSNELSTFAQQTNRSRHSSSSSSTSQCATPVGENLVPRSSQIRERSFSSTITNKIRPSTFGSIANSSNVFQTTSNDSTNRQKIDDEFNCRGRNGKSMSFAEFSELCGIGSNSKDCREKSEIEDKLEMLFDDRINSLREDLRESMNENKVSFQMNLIVELERMKNDLIEQMSRHSINDQLLEEIQRLRTENQRLRQFQPRL